MTLPVPSLASTALTIVPAASGGLSTTTTVAVIAAIVLIGLAWFAMAGKQSD